jgi:AraC family transcriptional regulator
VDVAAADRLANGTALDRIESRSHDHQPLEFNLVRFFSGSLWDGIRLQRVRMEPGEIQEGFLARHLIAVQAGSGASADMSWAGARRRVRRIGHGEVDVVPAGMSYSGWWPTASECIAIDVAPEFVASVAGRDASRLEIQPAFAVVDVEVAQIARLLAAEVCDGGTHGSLYGESLGTALTARLLRANRAVWRQVEAGRRALPAQKLRRIQDYIESHLGGRLSLQAMADALHMNVYGFLRAFKASTGVPPHRYVLERRIARAKSLLAHGELSLADVALSCGFASQSHFSTAFLRLVGATPGGYRRYVH